MNDLSASVSSSGHAETEREFTIFDFFIVVARHKKLIFWFPLLIAAIAAVVSFLMPNVYKATAKLLPPQQAQSGAAALLSQLGGGAGAIAGVAGLKSPNDLYVGMLKSRTVADRQIATFNLQDVYDVDGKEKTRKILEANTVITAEKSGLITIDVEDEDPKRVAKLTNGYVNELINLTTVLAVTEAAQRRMFYERQLELAKNNLAKAEMALKSGMESRGVISVDGESRAIVETVGRVRAQISAKEIELNAMQAFVTINNQQYKRVREELSSLREELSKLENGRPAGQGVLATASGGRVGLESIQILRDVKYHQMLYELLSKQYEISRLDEAKDSAVVQVLDAAIEPERKIKPKRALIVILSFILALFAALCWAFVLETKRKILAVPESLKQWEELKALSRSKKGQS